jgi:hypothetical protein
MRWRTKTITDRSMADHHSQIHYHSKPNHHFQQHIAQQQTIMFEHAIPQQRTITRQQTMSIANKNEHSMANRRHLKVQL